MRYHVSRSLGSRVVGPAVLVGLTVLGSSYFADSALSATAEPPQESAVQFDDQGRLIRPTGYREWVYVGTPLTPNDLNPPEAPFPDFHSVYIYPDDFEHYKRTGEFRDGTVIIKELVSVGSKQAVSGKGYFMGEFIGLEATIKDSQRFPDEPGNWAYFSFGHEYPLADSAEAFPASACNACHEASAADDWVFTQYYPVLRAARAMHSSGRTMTNDSEGYKRVAEAMTGALESGMKATAVTVRVDSAVPTDQSALFDYLKAGSYQQFPAQESTTHVSRGPHAKFGWPVRVFMDSKTDASLRAGSASHPAGSSIVKEMYNQSGDELVGWAVMVKTQADSANGQGWFWYETSNTIDRSDIVAAGNGIPLCFGCHSTGQDFVLSTYPPK